MKTNSKTFTWSNPTEALAESSRLSGFAVLEAMRDRTLPPPPMAVLINCDILEVAPGRVVFDCSPGEEHYNPLGTVHGGLMCTLLDTVLGCAAHTTLGAGVGYTSIDIKVSFIRPVTLLSGALTATGNVTKAGKRVIFTEGVVVNEYGELVATATSSLLVLSP